MTLTGATTFKNLTNEGTLAIGANALTLDGSEPRIFGGVVTGTGSISNSNGALVWNQCSDNGSKQGSKWEDVDSDG